jgi:ABC-type Zn uptake system ZnuABC Zn-binding protein ZnuA/ABC-type lipoprotein release transport system permease subunit
MVCTLSVFNGFRGLTAMLFSVFDPELKITLTEGKTFDPTTPAMQQIRTIPDVRLVCATLQEHALVRYGGRQAITVLKGVDDSFNQLVPIDTAIIDGSFKLREGEFHYAVPGIGLASTLGVNAAYVHPLEIYMPKRTGTINPANPATSFQVEYAHIGGVYHINQPVYDDGLMLVSIDLMRSMLDYDREVTALELKLVPGADVTSVKRKISQLAGENYTVQTRSEQQALSFRMIQIEKWVSYLMLCFILLLALFNVLGSLAILMIEKEADVIKLRTMGADDQLINRIFLFEGWMISLLGATIGVASGVALCYLQQRFGLVAMGETAGTFIIDAYPVEVEWTDVLTIFLTVIAAGFLSVLYPVHYLSRKWLGTGTLACLLLSLALTGCGTQSTARADVPEIAVSIEPLRYFAEKIAGDKYAFFPIVPAGQSPESYDPSPREILRAGKSRACFHIGRLGFEQNLVASISENNAGTHVFDLSEGADFHAADDHAPQHDDTADTGTAAGFLCRGHGGRDPHIWTSFEGARTISANIFKALSALDKENHDYYQSNYRQLTDELEAMENSLHEELKDIACRSFIIYHPALTYFSREFGLKQYSIENEGKEPSPAFLRQLIEAAKSGNVNVVFVQPEFDRRHAEQIAREIGAVTVVIDPLDYRWDGQIRRIAKALAENGKPD